MKPTLRLLSVSAAVFALALAACAPLDPPEKVLNGDFWEVQLEGGDLTLQWKVEGVDLHIIVSAPTTGFVGVGFDPTTRMLDANILIGWVDDATALATVRDDYAHTQTNHQADVDGGGESNVSAVSGTQTATSTTLDYTIPLDSGDSRDKALVGGEPHRFLLSYGATDDITAKHIARYSFDMEL